MKENLSFKIKYGLDEKPPLREAVPLSLQHILLMISSNIALPIILAGAVGMSIIDTAFLIQCAIFTSGITTIIQAFGLGPIGARLPIVMGMSFAFLAAGISVALNYGIPALLGAVIVCGVLEAFFGAFIIKYFRRFFPTIVTGSVVVVMGLSLLGVAVNDMAGGLGTPDYGSLQNYGLAFLTLIIILVLHQYGKGIWSSASVLIGMTITYIISGFMGLVDLSQLANAAWFTFPRPLKYGIDFNPIAIGVLMIIYLVSMIEFIGDTTGVTIYAAGREPSNKELIGGILCDGLGSAFSGLFNAMPNVSYSANVGMIGLTGVGSRFVVGIGGIIIAVLGFCPKLSTLFSMIPKPVLGGGMIVVFGLVAVGGIKVITLKPLTQRSVLLLAVSIGVGLGFSSAANSLANFPYLVSAVLSGVPGTAITAIILNIIFPKEKEESCVQESKVVNE